MAYRFNLRARMTFKDFIVVVAYNSKRSEHSAPMDFSHGLLKTVVGPGEPLVSWEDVKTVRECVA
jgi:hypothetical protein